LKIIKGFLYTQQKPKSIDLFFLRIRASGNIWFVGGAQHVVLEQCAVQMDKMQGAAERRAPEAADPAAGWRRSRLAISTSSVQHYMLRTTG